MSRLAAVALSVVVVIAAAIGLSQCGYQEPPTIAPKTPLTATPLPTLEPRIMAVMDDHANTDWLADYPIWPMQPGAWVWMGWRELQPQQHDYNWALLDGYLDDAYAMDKPVHLSIMLLADLGKDATPGWVDAEPWVVCDKQTGDVCYEYHAYNDANWDAAYSAFVAALGDRYDGDPRIASVQIATLLFGETVITRRLDGLSFELGHNPAQFVLNAIDWYDAAFDTTPLYIIATGTLNRQEITDYAAAKGVGVKQNGLAPDLNNHATGDNGRQPGLLTVLEPYTTTVDIAFEHACAASDMYWSALLALAYGADMVDVPPSYLDWMATTELLDGYTVWQWVERHENADYGLWVGRTTGHPSGDWSNGKVGPFAHRVWMTDGDVVYHARGGDLYSQYGYAEIIGTARFATTIQAPYRVEVIYRHYDDVWGMETWVETTSGTFDVWFADHVHRIEVWPLDATPTPVPWPTMTPSEDGLEQRVETLEAIVDGMREVLE